MPALAKEFNLSISTIYRYIEDYRQEIRKTCTNLAEQERENSLEQIDAAISNVLPHATNEREDLLSKARACDTLVKLIDRKAKLLGMDAPAKVEEVTKPKPPTEEEKAIARETLKKWTTFAPR